MKKLKEALQRKINEMKEKDLKQTTAPEEMNSKVSSLLDQALMMMPSFLDDESTIPATKEEQTSKLLS